MSNSVIDYAPKMAVYSDSSDAMGSIFVIECPDFPISGVFTDFTTVNVDVSYLYPGTKMQSWNVYGEQIASNMDGVLIAFVRDLKDDFELLQEQWDNKRAELIEQDSAYENLHTWAEIVYSTTSNEWYDLEEFGMAVWWIKD